MESLFALAGILFACMLGSMSPGPSFLFVARTSMAVSRQNGLAAAAGMGLGGFAYAVLAILGLRAVFASLPWLYTLIKLGGGAYLLYIGIQMWRGASRPLDDRPAGDTGRGTRLRAFAMASATQLSNPKTAIFYGSIFAALLPADPGILFTVILPVAVFVVEISWYSIVALLLSAAGPRAVYLRAKTALDRAAGAVMGLLGIKLITAADNVV
jgi:RhtB (resistance to homoserine/threonine) family protein